MKTYDALMIFPNSLKDEALDGILKDIDNEVAKVQGKVRETQRLGLKQFARPLNKMNTGYYVRMILELDPSQVVPLQGRLKLNENIFRLQIVAGGKKGMPAAAPAGVQEKGADHGES